LLLTVPLILVGGCGDDDSSSTSSGPANRQEGAADAQNGATGTTGTTSPRPKRTPKPDKSSSGGTGVPTQTVPTSPPKTTPEEKPAKKGPEDIKYPKLVGRELSKQARVVCGAIPLDQLVKTYRPKSSSPEDVAAAYAASYPASLRKAVAAGCKAGLLASE
jgi:hypothetical protein